MKIPKTNSPITVLGLMTGSSADGLDLCWVTFHDNRAQTEFKVLHSAEVPYPHLFKTAFLDPLKLDDAQIDELNVKLGAWFAHCIALFDIPFDAIASHGQTIKHEPPHGSLQIGDPTPMVKRFHKPVIYDFRSADIALGGQGAPLIPITDKLLLQDPDRDMLALNIGGISNLTVLPNAHSTVPIRAWDTGPGNTLIDRAVRDLTNNGRGYDQDGVIAARGKPIPALLDKLMTHDFLQLSPPKSAGQEQFGPALYKQLRPFISSSSDGDMENFIHTLTRFTAMTIAEAVRSVSHDFDFSTLHISGGGVYNKTLMGMLKENLPELKLQMLNSRGVHVSNKEAFGFAYLGYLRLMNRPGNLPSVTGARGETLLGKVQHPHEADSAAGASIK